MTKLQNKYPEQFNGPYYLGTSIDSGWFPLVERALERVRRELSAEEMATFHWKQIKEKFGRLCMYWNSGVTPVSFIGNDGAFTLAIDANELDKNSVQGDENADSDSTTVEDSGNMRASLSRKIDAIVQTAKNKAMRTCAQCGQPGRLYSEGYWATLCDEHAEGRMFPPVYGEWLDARDRQCIDSGNGRVFTDQVMYFRGVAIYSWRLKGSGCHDYVLADEMPEWLLDLVRAEGVEKAVFRGASSCLAGDIGRVVKVHAEELCGKASLVLPDGASINPEQAFSYEASKATGMGRLKVEHLVEPSQIAIAGVRMPDGSLRIFKQEHGEIAEVDYYPEIILKKRAKELEQMAEVLRKMLQEIKGNEA